jgi:ribosomal peptide maturation radical SAM protein 1
MPDCSIALPPIALGLLTAILGDAGFRVKTLYANLWFTDIIGRERLRIVRQTRVEDMARDWLFTRAAFREEALPGDPYLEKLLERNSGLRRRGKAAAIDALHKLRDDAEKFIETAARRVLEHRPKIVGCTSTFQQHIASLALLRRIRELAPDVVTMMGGANCETEMGRVTHRAFPWVDYIVSGEADELIVPLCRAAIDEGRNIAADDLPTGVFGPIHREVGYPTAKGGDGVPRAIVDSLAGAPTPNYDDYFETLQETSFKDDLLPAISFESSRGCWWGERSHCTFCGLNGLSMGFRGKAADVVMNDIEKLHARYGATSFHAVDSIIDMHYFDTLLPELAKRKLPIRFFYETKSNLKRSHVEMLRDAGVLYLQPGIESLCTDVLKLIGKGVTAVQNVQLLKHARQVGVRITWTNLLGLPNEKDEWYADSAVWMPLLTHLQPGHLGWLRYDRYSPYFSRSKHYGLELQPAELYGKVYPLDEAELSQIAYFFERRDHAIRPKLDGGHVTANLSDQDIPDDGPGRMAYRQAVIDWQNAWNKTVPVLQCQDIDEVLCVEDTRAVAPEPKTKVEGLSREVMLLLAEDAHTRSHICKLMENMQGVDASHINDVVDQLIQRKLAMEVDNKVVNLVLFAPLPVFPNAWLSRAGGAWV